MKYINIKQIFSLLLFIAVLAACKRDKGEVLLQPRNERDIIEVMQRETNGDFSMLLEALQVTGLDVALSVEANKNPEKRFILFAPTNKAFAALLLQLGSPSIAQTDKTVLTEILKGHVHPTDSSKNFKLSQFNEGDLPTLKAGVSVTYNVACDEKAYLNGSTIVAFERLAKNGYVYAIEDVLQAPTSTMAEVLNSDPDYSILNQLINKAGLKGTFENLSTSYTLFAPSNAGLIDVGFVPANFNTAAELALLDSVLRYHLLSGKKFALSVCPETPYVSLLGQDLQLDATSVINGRYADWVEFVKTNASITKNGVIHKVDYPVVPATINIKQRLATMPELPGTPTNSYAIAKQALALTGLDMELDKVDRVTLLLPTDAAFQAFLTLNNIPSIFEAPVDKLTEILKFHLLMKRVFINDMGASFRTLQGENLTTPAGNATNFNLTPYGYGSPAGRADIRLTNGNIQVIKSVQVPVSVKLKQAPPHP